MQSRHKPVMTIKNQTADLNRRDCDFDTNMLWTLIALLESNSRPEQKGLRRPCRSIGFAPGSWESNSRPEQRGLRLNKHKDEVDLSSFFESNSRPEQKGLRCPCRSIGFAPGSWESNSRPEQKGLRPIDRTTFDVILAWNQTADLNRRDCDFWIRLYFGEHT